MDISRKPIEITPEIHQKGWGEEIWVVNTPLYCLKKLVFAKESRFSLHFHIEKDETWCVENGTFQLTYIDLHTAEHHTITLKEGDIYRIPPMLPHRLETETGGVILEVSTEHKNSDSYRIQKGDSQ